MTYFINHKLVKEQDGYIIELYLDQQLNEFSLEFLGLGRKSGEAQKTDKLEGIIENYLRENLPGIKVNVAKIMLGSLLIASIPFSNAYASTESTPTISVTQSQTGTTYTVKAGDTLYLIAKKFGTTIPILKAANGLTSDLINIGQQLQILNTQKGIYIVQPGDTLYKISKQYNLSIEQLKYANGLTEDVLRIGQSLKIPAIISNPGDILALVNKNNNLPSSYVPGNLVVPNVLFSFKEYDDKKLMRQDAAPALEEMFKSAKADGITLYAVSCYRSYARQSSIFATNVSKYGSIEGANQFSAIPGQSEHQTGLAIDVTSASANYGLNQAFGNTKEGKWVRENAHRFGFIIRYQQGKEAITGYQYEPWHIRYVGKETAKEITTQNITLEEFLGHK